MYRAENSLTKLSGDLIFIWLESLFHKFIEINFMILSSYEFKKKLFTPQNIFLEVLQGLNLQYSLLFFSVHKVKSSIWVVFFLLREEKSVGKHTYFMSH